MENIFQNNKVYCYLKDSEKYGIKEIDLSKYKNIDNIVSYVKSINKNPDIDFIIFGNINNKDFCRRTRNIELSDFIIEDIDNNWKDIVEKFENEFSEEISDFELDDNYGNEFSYNFYPEDFNPKKVTLKGWKNLKQYFFEKLDSIVANYPISIISKYEEFDKDYEIFKINFEIDINIEDTKIIKS